MGNTATKVAEAAKPQYFIIDRLLAANCDFLGGAGIRGNTIQFGVFGSGAEKESPLGHQGIRIGDGPIHILKAFSENGSGLVYEFEDNVRLNLFKRDGGDACYNLRTDTLNVTRPVDPAIRKFYKPLYMRDASEELDKIEGIMR